MWQTLTSSLVPEAGPHVMAVVNRLREVLPKNVKVNIAVAPAEEKAKPPYVVIYPDTGYVDSSRLAQIHTDISVGLVIHAVGSGPEQCLWVMDKVRSALVMFTPTIPGRRCQQITQSQDTQRPTQAAGYSIMTRDFSTQPPVYLIPAEFTISSQYGEPHA